MGRCEWPWSLPELHTSQDLLEVQLDQALPGARVMDAKVSV